MDKIITENYCDECGNQVHATFDKEDFYNFKVGLVRCSECGHIIKPCNECMDVNGEGYSSCANCPWTGAKVVDSATNEEYLRFIKENDTSLYEAYKNEDNGFVCFSETIKKLEEED